MDYTLTHCKCNGNIVARSKKMQWKQNNLSFNFFSNPNFLGSLHSPFGSSLTFNPRMMLPYYIKFTIGCIENGVKSPQFTAIRIENLT